MTVEVHQEGQLSFTKTTGKTQVRPGSQRGGRTVRPVVELGQLFDRLPPNAIEAEMALLGSMLLDSAVTADVLEYVKSPEAFYRAAHGAIYQALIDLYNDHNAGDIAMLYQILVDRGIAAQIGGVEYLEQLAASTPVSVNAGHYARIVAEKALLRRLIGAAGEILHSAYTCGDDVRAVLDSAELAIFDVVEQNERQQAVSLAELLQETLQLIQSRDGELVTGLRTGFRDLDEQTSGLQDGDLIIIAARPSMGKTAFALNIAENIALLGNPVGIFSLEMSKQQLSQRLLCSRSEVDSHRLRRNTITEDDYRRLAFAVGELSEAPIFIDDTPSLSVLELRAKARRMAANNDIKMIVVDYLQLLTGASRENRQQEVSEISRGIKALARELNIPIVCLSQLNRAAEIREGHRPRLADLRESGSIEQDADVVALLHREEYFHNDPEWARDNPDKVGLAELIIAKQRNGPTGTVKLTWVGSSMKFKDLSRTVAPEDFNVGGDAGHPGFAAPESFGAPHQWGASARLASTSGQGALAAGEGYPPGQSGRSDYEGIPI